MRLWRWANFWQSTARCALRSWPSPFHGLIAELSLETKYFVPYTAANDPVSLFDLTFNEQGGKRHGIKLTALELLALGILRPLNLSG